jgi:hypothetical protein
MASIYIVYYGDIGGTYTATVERLADNYFRPSASETFSNALSFAAKEIALTEGSAELEGVYRATLTGDTWTDGWYLVTIYNDTDVALGGSLIYVKNGREVESPSDVDVYHADIQFTKDSTTDQYTVTWFKNGVRITSGITSPTLQVVNRADGTNLIAASAMTQIGSTGSYKLDSTGSRQTIGVAYPVIAAATIDGATRSFSWILGRDSN